MYDPSSVNVLYVGFTLLGDQEATGQTLNNIYSACNRINILQLCMDYSADYHTTGYETVYISPTRSRAYFEIKQYYRKKLSKGEDSGQFSTMNISGERFTSSLARCVLDILPRRLDKGAYDKIEKFKPDCILTLGENIATDKMALHLSEKYNIPIVLHVMDNLEDSFCSSFGGLRLFRNMYLSLNNQLFDRSVKNFAIGKKMADEYGKRHQQEFVIAMNCIDSLHEKRVEKKEKLLLLFSGGLHGGRAESLLSVAGIIKETPELSDLVTMEVYSSPQHIVQYGAELKSKCTVFPYVPKNEIYDNLGRADILLHVESFGEKEIEFFRYSMSTKIPEYLSVGRPILCYGSREICSVDYINSKKVGISADSLEEVAFALKLLAGDSGLRLVMGKRALQVAQEEHLQSKVAERVESLYMSVREEWRRSAAKC